jgi:hypothetical protein
MLKAGHQQRFSLEALAELGVSGNLVVHDFDDDLPAQIQLPGQINAPHAAFSQKADGFISAKKNTAYHADHP